MSTLDSIPKLFDIEAALRAETNAVHPREPPVGDDVAGEDLYRELHARCSTALCLSGGGLRSAAFALGVIEALALHPRLAPNQEAPTEDRSLLCQFNYLSTVSGGGYIGSWLSAWIARAGFQDVWTTLVGWRPRPDKEPSEIGWLRSYTKYLTARTGPFSPDTWAAMSLHVRNLFLNWVVILPALFLALFAVKIGAIVAFWISLLRMDFPRFFLVGGVIAMVVALRFALLNRPSRDPCTIRSGTSDPYGRQNDAADMKDPHQNESMRVRSGSDEATFIRRYLLPAVLAAFLLSIYLLMRGPKLAEWGLFKAATVSLVAGIAIYALAWISAWPPATWVPCRTPTVGRRAEMEVRSGLYWVRDFISWAAAGGVYGAIIGASTQLVASSTETGAVGDPWVWLLIGNANVDHATAVFLIAFIYGVPGIVMAQLIAEMVFVGVTSWQPYSDSDREWFNRSSGWFGVSALGWLVATWLVLVGADIFVTALFQIWNSEPTSKALIGIGGAIFSGLISKWLNETVASPHTLSAAQPGLPTRLLVIVARVAVPVGALIFLIALTTILSGTLDLLLFKRWLSSSSLMTIDRTLEAVNQALAANRQPTIDRWQDVQWLIIGVIVVSIVAFFAWRGLNINRFSAHSVYRNRLIRAFLGASNPRRAPNPFTGFDEEDNIPMHRTWGAGRRDWQPFHVINIAMNIVNSKRLAWQERTTESFIVTPLHCGSAASGLGFRETKEYGDRGGEGLTLGTAFAISGAVANPSVGYSSLPVVTLMLMLFNARLGWWLGNPGPYGETTFGQQGPSNAIKPFIRETFGLTTEESDYVYLSDGGHFDNLGLYEMIRRRCRYIVLSDAGCDPECAFVDLGNAVREIAIDLGAHLSFGDLRALKKRSEDNSVIEGAYYAIGEIDYPKAPGGDEKSQNGYILYIKPGYHGTESPGVVAYAAANPAFPHESTADQFFSDAQFESYRSLGFEIMDSVLRKGLQRIAPYEPSEATDRPGGVLGEIIEALARPS